MPDADIVDVVVPVHGNISDANRLFAHLVAAANNVVCRIVIVDDASGNAGDLVLPRPGGRVIDVCILHNEVNLGFAASVNKAIRFSHRDVVLLNTDTLVFDFWLDRLRAVSRSRCKVATVTPFSNAATILSYPTSPNEYQSDLEIGWRRLDALCAQVDAAPLPVPTGVGFCMFITRASIASIGVFDETTFRYGYGEECDFCRRAASVGWTNLAAPNVFVWHRGEGSFASRAKHLRAAAQSMLLQRHPDYPSLVSAFIRSDPLLGARRALDYGRLGADSRSARLHLRVGAPRQPDVNRKEMFFLRDGRLAPRYRPALVGFADLPNLPRFRVTSVNDDLKAFLRESAIEDLVLYPAKGFARLFFKRLARAARQVGLRVLPFSTAI